MYVLLPTTLLLIASNVFMNLAWYGHLGSLKDQPVWKAVLASWGIAFFEYLLQVPANRLGHTKYDMSQLKILQEVISLSVFVPIAVLLLGQKFRWDYVWASLCVLAAVFFIFRGQGVEPAPHDAASVKADVKSD